MQYRRLGNSGLQVSEISLGSWLTFGESVDPGATRDVVRHGCDLGINLFDTADVYANGDAERALARALDGVARDRVVLATKCFFPTSDAANAGGLSRKHLFESVEASLRRLGTDYLDLHQCHRYDPDTPLEETVRAYEDLIRQGKVLYWGTSLWTRAQLASACEIADTTGGYRPVSNQPVYSILRRDIEREVLPGSRDLGVGQIVYSPLAQGALTGKYSGGQRPAGSRASDSRLGRFMQRYLDPTVLERIDALGPLAAEAGCSLTELALAWCLRDRAISSVIVGATSTAQLEQNVLASGRKLAASILDRIDGLFAPGTDSLPSDPDTP